MDTTPLLGGHSRRGIGTYTRELVAALEKESIEVTRITKRRSISKGEFDLIHYPYFDLFAPTLHLHRSIPGVITIHDLIPLQFPEHYKPGIRGKLAHLRQKRSLQKIAHVITDSEFSKGQLLQYLGFPEEKISVVPLAGNPAVTPQDTTTVAKISRRLKLPKMYVLYVGDINYNKNIPQLIKMLKFLPDSIALVCVGKNFTPQPIPEWEAIERQIALSNVANRVHFYTDVGPDETDVLSVLYSEALCLVQPSLSEGFGLPVLEAMQCGTPVVSTRLGSLPEVGGALAFFATETAESLAEQVLLIHALTQDHRIRLAAESIAWSKTFTWQKTAVATIAAYQRAIS
ncbi:MAG: glycosyltransferase family 1 protein [bacterium]|nr:glycosyltransferase family 1 protein [bacterium]